MSYFPSFVKDVFTVSVSMASLMILFPYLVYFIVSVGISPFGDYLLRKGVRLIIIRKSFVVCGNLLTAIFLIIGGYCNTLASAIVLMTLSVGCSGIAPAGFNANMLDVSSKYSGIVMGISNTIATIPGIVSPYIVTAMIGNDPTADDWRMVFIISACIIAFSSFFYAIFARATPQTSLLGEE